MKKTTPSPARNGTIEQILASGIHCVYFANGLLYEQPKGVTPAPPLEAGLANPVRIGYTGGKEEQYHKAVAMLGAKWYRDITPPDELFFDPAQEQKRLEYNNRATALTITLATGEQVTKLIFTHKKSDSKMGAHIIYTVFTKAHDQKRLLLEQPELLCNTLPGIVSGYNLTRLTLTRGIHYAHPTDLTSDSKIQKAFRVQNPFAEVIRLYQEAVILHDSACSQLKETETLQAGARAQIALLNGERTTQRFHATAAFETRLDLEAKRRLVESEKEALARDRAATQKALGELDSRDERVRKAAQDILRAQIENMQKERDEYRTLVETTEADLATRTAELGEAAEVVDDLAAKVDKLNMRIKELGG